MKGHALFLLVLLSSTTYSLFGQASDTIRLCTYNLGYFDTTEIERLDELRLILDGIRPSVLAVQGLYSDPYVSHALDYFMDSVLAYLPGTYQRHGYYPTSDSNVLNRSMAIYFDVTSVRELSKHGTSLYSGYIALQSKKTHDTILVFNVDWGVASDGRSDSNRAGYAESLHFRLRDYSDELFEGWYSNVVVLGTMGVQSSEDLAYRKVLQTPGDRYSRQLFDGAATPGTWSNDAEFSTLHSCHTRVNDTASGLRDRFDHILLSSEVVENLIPGSYHVFGNDGHHFGDSINHGNNLDVSKEIADALHTASPHLPVFIDLVFSATSSVDEGTVPLRLDMTSSQPARNRSVADTLRYSMKLGRHSGQLRLSELDLPRCFAFFMRDFAESMRLGGPGQFHGFPPR